MNPNRADLQSKIHGSVSQFVDADNGRYRRRIGIHVSEDVQSMIRVQHVEGIVDKPVLYKKLFPDVGRPGENGR
jgi:hypothetical protein